MTSVSLDPTDDSYVNANEPSTNHGTATGLFIVSLFYLDSYDHRIFLKFDLSELPVGAIISSATLKLYCYEVNSLMNGVSDVQAKRVSSDSWVESTVTWTNQPSMGDTEDTQTPAIGWVEWDVTDWAVNQFADDKTLSVGLKSATESYDETARNSLYRSSRYGSNTPQLDIVYTAPVLHQVTISESVGFSDYMSRSASFKQALAEKLGFVDSISRRADFKQAIADSIGLVDSTLEEFTYKVHKIFKAICSKIKGYNGF